MWYRIYVGMPFYENQLQALNKTIQYHKNEIPFSSSPATNKAVFQNVSIQSLYAVLLLYINCVDMQSYQTMHQL